MNKVLLATASGVLATSLFAGAALAKSDNGNGAEKKAEAAVKVEASVDTKANKNVEKTSQDTVTDNTYGSTGHQGYKGLLNAIENVKDKPAGAVIADLLLTKYDGRLTAEQKAELEAIKEKDEALSAVADLLEQQGSVTDAVYVQKDAIKANIKNINSYKKLGKLYDKLGKKGVKLYVNGEEPSFEVAPFIRDGNTLVPFRAISEALKADVAWNEEERSVTVTRDGISVKLYIGSTTAYVDGKEVTLEVPAAIADGSTVVPVRFVSEALKAAVNWEPETSSVIINEE
ncbi:copper amine oxidase N-terminal domain-containing protein [Paenibacillus sp. NPDC056579]|uniref:copper amine oxidase N-terminal domain-containing protein n=1 Tax=Paenibacillus sp. NPDC056579 TaxID=3345871 RepID=UPI0036C22CF7